MDLWEVSLESILVILQHHSPLRLCNPKKRVGNKRVSFFQIFFLDSSDKGRDIISKKAARNGTASWTLPHVPGVVLSKGDNDRGCRHSCPGLKPRGVRSLWGRHRAWRAVLSGFGHACHPSILTEETHAVMLPSCGCRSRAEHGTGEE